MQKNTKRPIVELIVFLINHFEDYGSCPESAAAGKTFEEIGFDAESVFKVFTLLEEMNFEPQWLGGNSTAPRAYWPGETAVLTAEVRGEIHRLEQAGILTAAQREYIIHVLMMIVPEEEADADMVKGIALLMTWANRLKLPAPVRNEMLFSLHKESTIH